MPMFYRACQGHSTFAASSERMYVPYDPGQVRSHGSLLHITDLQTFLESTSGRVRFPTSDSGLCLGADYELLRLLPANNSPTMPDPSNILPWLSQRRHGQPLAARSLVPMNYPAQRGEPPS
eukprot:7927031-Pyramimonas_sp.AAC.1